MTNSNLILYTYYQLLTKTRLLSKRACPNFEKCSLRGRKWGLGLPKHITMLFIIMNIVFILTNIYSYTLLVLNSSILDQHPHIYDFCYSLETYILLTRSIACRQNVVRLPSNKKRSPCGHRVTRNNTIY